MDRRAGSLPGQLVCALALLAAGCVLREPLPLAPPLGPHAGIAPSDFDTTSACESWRWATASPAARKHDSFPEFSPRGCFATVQYAQDPERIISASMVDADCEYTPAAHEAELLARAQIYERIAAEPANTKGALPLELACELPAEVRKRAAETNARTLRSLAEDHRAYAYAAGITFGYGNSEQDASGLVSWRPGDECLELSVSQRALLSVNNQRAERVAETFRSGLAPVVIVSGGAVHAQVVEAFMLTHLATCNGDVPLERVLVDPCADHTHTNVRNSGALVRHLTARTAYVVTDDFLQGDYLQEFTGFELIGGSIDDRSLRDFGYLLGSWRQASRGIGSGFWFTPYRFWGDANPELRDFACVGDVSIATLRPAD